LQLGGGLRTVEHLERAFAAGVDRAVLGSAAINDPAFAIAAIRRWPGRIALGLDARDGMLAANGWVEQTTVRATELGARLRAEGFSTFVFTDIARDGTLTGPNTEALREMATALSEPVDGVEPAHLIASGGVAEVADVERVAATGATGIIIGRALYDGRVDLAEALAAARAVTPGITEARA
jgi:phosphoribosylformimino-5-aminoimidazole carboxamide ribotide isomerase